MTVNAAGVAFLQEVNVRFAAVIPARSLAGIGPEAVFHHADLTARNRTLRRGGRM